MLILLHNFLPPMPLLDSPFLHEKESNPCVESTHYGSKNDITWVVHPIMDSRDSHDEYNDDSKCEKSFFEIGNNQDKEACKGHMARRK